VSDRTGGWEIYMSDLAGKSVVPLTSFGNLVVDGIRWAPQGDELSFAVLRDNNRDIYVMRPDGGPPRQLTTESSDDGRPSYSSDGQSIYFRSNRSGREEIWKMPRAGGPAVQVTREGAFEALESPDGKTLYFVRARAVTGLWRMPVEGGTAEPVPGLESVVGGRWDVTDDGICYLAPVGSAEPFQSSSSTNQGSDHVLVCWNTRSGKRTEMGAVHKPVWAAGPVFSASRDGRRLLWNQTDHLTQDLVLVENFR
jgi:dipeptidyl aminopeptidase/acylaminoacyl peptidase